VVLSSDSSFVYMSLLFGLGAFGAGRWR